MPFNNTHTHQSPLLFHDLLSCSYLQHCVYSVITGHNSLQTVCL